MDRDKLKEELCKELKIYSEMNNGFMTDRDCTMIAKFSSKICIEQLEEGKAERQYCQVCGKDITDIDNQLFCKKCIKPRK